MTFIDKLVPSPGPAFETLCVVFFDFGAFLNQLDQVSAEPVTVVDPLGRALVVARLPERVARRRQQIFIAMVRHFIGSATAPPPAQ